MPPELQAPPPTWRARPVWRLLQVGSHWPARFLDIWQTWLAAPQRPAQLHMVCIADDPPELRSLGNMPGGASPALWQELTRQCWGLLPGTHRLVFEGGSLQLTLCIASPLAHLREQDLAFDGIELDHVPAVGTELAAWATALARCSQRGSTLSALHADQAFADALRNAGFIHQKADRPGEVHATFDPPWQTGTRRPQRAALYDAPGRCSVGGAGLAGAACAASLARRGWQVTVLDRQGPAAGASGLPVGLMAPHVSVDDSSLSRLSRSGVRATLEAARQWLTEGRDWAPTGVLQRRLDKDPTALPRDWPQTGHAWSCPAQLAGLAAHLDDLALFSRTSLDHALWHPSGAWIRPARLIAAWLGQHGIALGCGMEVTKLRQTPDQRWQTLDAQGQVLTESELVILANAYRAQDLLTPWLPDFAPRLQPVRGQVSWALQAPDERLPQVPVNGHGSLVSYPTDDGRAWLLGATFDRDDTGCDLRAQDHEVTLGKLQQLLPETAASLAPRFTRGEVQAWAGVRCSWRDHLPLVGPVSGQLPGLWLCTGFGSRGLSYSAVCAELIAAWLHAEPLPLPARLAQQVHASRLMKPR